jgi:hypothetical protein
MKTYTVKLHNGICGELTDETLMRFRIEGIINNYKEIIGCQGTVKSRNHTGVIEKELSGYITALTVTEEHG